MRPIIKSVAYLDNDIRLATSEKLRKTVPKSGDPNAVYRDREPDPN
jgi:hypothetical protein